MFTINTINHNPETAGSIARKPAPDTAGSIAYSLFTPSSQSSSSASASSSSSGSFSAVA